MPISEQIYELIQCYVRRDTRKPDYILVYPRAMRDLKVEAKQGSLVQVNMAGDVFVCGIPILEVDGCIPNVITPVRRAGLYD